MSSLPYEAVISKTPPCHSNALDLVLCFIPYFTYGRASRGLLPAFLRGATLYGTVDAGESPASARELPKMVQVMRHLFLLRRLQISKQC